MDVGLKKTIDKQFEVCKKNLLNNQFAVDILESRDDVIPFLESVIEKGSSVGVGGSVTLSECNVIKWLEGKEDINYIDRYNTDDRVKAMKDHLTCDIYITSSNAVLLSGGLYNVDGTGNRVSALTYGPNKVYIVVGYNKIVSDLDVAIDRVESYAAIANNFRLNKDNPCTKTGKCAKCNNPGTVCNTYVYTRRCYEKDRIHVILVKESLGY